MELKICNVLTKGKEVKCIDGRIEPQVGYVSDET